MNRKRRGVSFGTVFMLCMVVLTLGGSAFVLTRLSGGGTVDLARLGATLQLDGEAPKQEVDDILIREEGKTAEKKPTVTKAPAENSEKNTFTLAVGGLAAIETEVRRSCYSNDSKKYDFSDVFAALKPAFSADLSCIFLENILSDDYKVSTSVVPAAAADMLRGAGIQVAMLQYTGTLSAATKKSLAKNGQEAMLPEAEMETIAAGIRDARSRGAGAVVILVNWGKDGKAPDKAQKALAQQIADAGADLIIGAGSRIPQAPEVLKAAGTGREVLCVYSAGTLLSDNRKSAKRLGSYLLHVTFTGDGEGTAVSKVEYTPVYIWRYKQDGKFYYRCVAANGAAPDGMDSEQMKTMEKAVAAVSDALEGTSLTVRGAEAGR